MPWLPEFETFIRCHLWLWVPHLEVPTIHVTLNFNMLKRALSRYKRALQLIPSTVICQLGIQVNRFILIPHLPRLVSQKFLPNLVTRAWQITLSTLLKLYLVRHSTLREIQIELQKHQ